MRTKIWTERGWTFSGRSRGRPRGRFHSYADTKLLEYIAELSVRHEIDSNEFFGKFVEAWENRESTCKKLTIECRRKTRDSAIFLITTDCKVIAQFPIPEYLLRETDPLNEFGYVLDHARRVLEKKREMSRATCLRIKDLKAGMKRVNLKARVTEISEPKLAFTRFNDYVKYANAVLSDDTSSIKLTLWNDRIKMVSVNDVIQIENADVIIFRGEPQLRTGKNGRLKILDKNNLAAIQGLERERAFHNLI
jgi:replication factor A1